MFQILVVEDDKELCDLFCTVLTDNGYTAVPAADGLAAFDILDDTYIDLVISDIMMPRMDGFELTKALRESGYTHPDYHSQGKRHRQTRRIPSGYG